MEIKIDNVSYSYNKVNYETKEVLNNVTIEFKEGKINALIGTGKTTLLSILYGLLEPDNGRVIIGNNVLNKQNTEKIRFDIGMVFQNFNNLFLYDTIKEELEATIRIYNYRLSEKNKRILDSLVMVGLDETYINRKIDTLSMGEKRKLAFAQTLILNPKIIILDEPTINLDRTSKKELIKLLRLLKNRYNKTIIIASNNMDFILEFSDYIYVLSDKKLMLEGNKIDVFTNPSLKNYNVELPKIIDFENALRAVFLKAFFCLIFTIMIVYLTWSKKAYRVKLR